MNAGEATKAGGSSRRQLLVGATAALAAVPLQARAEGAARPVPADSTRVPGAPVDADGGYGRRSQFETAERLLGPPPNPLTSWSFTPLADLVGTITPSGLHYERDHAGVPTIDPKRHSLTVHGMVNAPKRFTMSDLKRMPSVTRKHFIECSGNTLSEWAKPSAKTVQVSHGLLSTSEWTGVAFSTLARETGIAENAKWVLAEGADAALMARSIPIDKMLTDAFLAYGQNGEAIRPEQGYPLRLLLPGYEGNTNIKWIRRIFVSDSPFMTREETSKYTDLKANGIADQFNFIMEAKSVITSPSGGMRLDGPGYHEITGLAWSGNGRISRVEVSLDGGATWVPANLDGEPLPKCTVRFSFPWRWTGGAACLKSRCFDETGYAQPTHEELVALYGTNFVYHYNGIQAWQIEASGEVGIATV